QPDEPRDDHEQRDRFRLCHLDAEQRVLDVDSDLLDEQTLETGEHEIRGEEKARAITAAAHRPEHEEQRERGRGLIKRRRVDPGPGDRDRKSTRLNSSHVKISYAVFCLKKKKNKKQ